MARRNPEPIDVERIALGVHQPWAELILRGVKTIELRRTSTTRLERIYLYATKQEVNSAAAKNAIREHQLNLEQLPRGLIVGIVEIVAARKALREDAAAACVPRNFINNCYAWELANPRLFAEPIPAPCVPYGTWFYPFQRKTIGA